MFHIMVNASDSVHQRSSTLCRFHCLLFFQDVLFVIPCMLPPPWHITSCSYFPASIAVFPEGSTTVLTDGLTVEEQRQEEKHKQSPYQCSGWANKSAREKDFPLQLVKKGLLVSIVKGEAWIHPVKQCCVFSLIKFWLVVLLCSLLMSLLLFIVSPMIINYRTVVVIALKIIVWFLCRWL